VLRPDDETLREDDDGNPDHDGRVTVESTEVLLLESYPVQVVLQITGTLPTPCHDLAHTVADDGTRIDVALSAQSSGESCAQVIEPFNERVALGSYAAGARTIWVNGDRVGDFDLGAGVGEVVATPETAFTLRPGSTATLESDGTLIRFDGVENDSRCPRDVVCIRAGDATVVLTVTSPGEAATTVRVLVDPDEGVASADGLLLHVTALAPKPVSTTAIAPGEYVATLVVER